MSTPGGHAQDDFVAAAVQALRAATGSGALAALGWWDLLVDLDDDEGRVALFTLFRAQGRELASSAALGGLMAQPYVAALGIDPGSIVATISRESVQRGTVTVVVGDAAGCQLLVDRPGRGAAVLAPDEVELDPVDVPGGLLLHEVHADLSGRRPTMSEAGAAVARVRSLFLGRVAIAMDILGAAESALELAVEHARLREQFGQPIGSFQAVRHLLAWATTDCTAVEHVAAEAVRLDTTAPPTFGEITKAIAGRNGRRVCERSLQVLGAVGFTAEHAHHRFYSRILALDSLLGTSTQLTRGLGAWIRHLDADPQIPAALLPTSSHQS